MQLPQGTSEPVEVRPLPAHHAVSVFGRTLGAIPDSGYSSHHQILHFVTVEDLDQTSEVVRGAVRRRPRGGGFL